MNNKITIGLILLVIAIVLAGCSKPINEVKTEEYVGETVSVSGKAQGVIKIGKLSGYTLIDEEGNKIGIATSDLPEEGEEVTVKGIVMKDTLLGYYIQVK